MITAEERFEDDQLFYDQIIPRLEELIQKHISRENGKPMPQIMDWSASDKRQLADWVERFINLHFNDLRNAYYSEEGGISVETLANSSKLKYELTRGMDKSKGERIIVSGKIGSQTISRKIVGGAPNLWLSEDAIAKMIRGLKRALDEPLGDSKIKTLICLFVGYNGWEGYKNDRHRIQFFHHPILTNSEIKDC